MRKLGIYCALACLINSCSFNNVDNADELKPFFDTAHVQGCFALYDNSRNEFTIYNKEGYLKRYPPGGTFNVLTTLIGLQTGKVFDENARIGDMTLTDAFRDDSSGYFRELARRLGRDTMVHRIRALSYGNMDTLAPVDSIWLHGLTISPDEQLGFVKQLYFNQLPFQQRTQEVMRTVMEREKTQAYTLSYAQATAQDSTGLPLGWILGWVEERRHPYFFVLFTSGGAAPLSLLKTILTEQGFFKGVK